MDDCTDSLVETQVFKELETLWGCWQVTMYEEKDKATFIYHLGTYRYTRMPFGISNAPATFQCELHIILFGVRWETCLVYIDDMVILSRNSRQHVNKIAEVVTLVPQD